MKVLNCALDAELRNVRALILELKGCTVVSPPTPEDALREMKRGVFDVLLLSYDLPGETVEQLCDEFKRLFPEGKIAAIHHPSARPNECPVDEFVSAFDPAALVSAVTGQMP